MVALVASTRRMLSCDTPVLRSSAQMLSLA
jgi:hypothetical protein